MEDKEFQNLLAVRGQIVTLLIATTAGTVGLFYTHYSFKTIMFTLIGVIFLVNLIRNLVDTNFKINQIIRKEKNGD